MDILLKVISDDAKPLRSAVPSVPPDLETVVMKCLNKQAGLGRFREDLYYRIGRPLISIPPLRKRPEEIPWLIEATVRR